LYGGLDRSSHQLTLPNPQRGIQAIAQRGSALMPLDPEKKNRVFDFSLEVLFIFITMPFKINCAHLRVCVYTGSYLSNLVATFLIK
jgi:hypothetical protein